MKRDNWWMGNTVHFENGGASLLAFWLCGVAGVWVDIDHPIAYWWLPELSGRFLHTPLLIACGIVLFSLGAYLAGLYFKLVLTRGRRYSFNGEA